MDHRLELLEALREGATLVTPNNRLSAELLSLYCQTYKANHSYVEKPACFPFQTYLQKLYQREIINNPETEYPVLLSPKQQYLLWVDIIQSAENGLVLHHGLIQEVSEAWNRCQRWQLDLNHPFFSLTPQTSQFQIWANQFQARIDVLQAISEEQLIAFFLQQKIAIQGDMTIIWFCFEEYTPAQLCFQEYLRAKGANIIHRDLKLSCPSAFLYKADEEETEYEELISWISQRLKAKDKRIGVIVPDLQNKAEGLQRLLQLRIPELDFNISLGKPLSDFPIISHALSWLKLKTTTICKQEAHLLLYSPFLAFSEQEKIARLQCLHSCPALSEKTSSLSFLLMALKISAPKLAALLSNIKPYPERAAVNEWIETFSQRLEILGFPGEYSLSSESYQCYMRFLSLFDEFRELGFVTPMMDRQDALEAFETIARISIFQTKTTTSPLQILGLLEATGCVFDSLWVSNMSNECLPQKTKLSAFIPARLQRELAMPHACPNRELSLASKMIARLKASATISIIFSYPCLTADKPNLPSPLIASLPPYKPLAFEKTFIATLIALEPYKEDYRHPLGKDEKIRGGTALLGNQAKCPFRAFATHRLHPQKAIAQSDGLNPIERGKIVHKIMEELWKELKNQQTLRSMPSAALESLIQSIIENALKPYQPIHQHSFPPLVQAVEKKRLSYLIKASFEWEKTRPPFKVEAVEKGFSIEIQGHIYQLRVDRLDTDALGNKWVIDYKSALPATLPWKEERPREPQLLLYALVDDKINTLVFASLKEGKLQIKGLSEQPAESDGITSIKANETWAEYCNEWQQQINQLALEYQAGYCPPKPLSPAICQQCDFQALCRYE